MQKRFLIISFFVALGGMALFVSRTDAKPETIHDRLQCDEEMIKHPSPLLGGRSKAGTVEPIRPIARPGLGREQHMVCDVVQSAHGAALEQRRAHDQGVSLVEEGNSAVLRPCIPLC